MNDLGYDTTNNMREMVGEDPNLNFTPQKIIVSFFFVRE